MQESIVALTSFLAGALLLLVVLQSPASKRICNRTCNNAPRSVLDTIATAEQQPPTILSENSRNELLMGYDLLTDIFNGQSKLWLVPILRRLSRGTPLLEETTDVIQKLVDSGSKRKEELGNTLRNLPPNVSQKFIDPLPPNRLVESIGKHVAWNVMQDLSTRGDDFNLNFALVQMSSARFVYSVALGLLEVESNTARRQWLKDVAKEYSSLRTEVRDVMYEYIRGEERIFLGNGQATRSSG
mmetsp:Transcript_28538/g.60830  ORF Transcript_28538/g.60830 Transcript_28538/m.60830 type:complete len:242 (-) Transcript_28538:276-1001(-)|eukprot:CAMPEP_0172325258 /NCGR_PEP_ID=MMETSP1058-20130122/53534_1 /TAXON_ID=83371 /ORGANISM="Detonula confervacea, Strain CCMP 353" /LENGTH=241 /DNA_ID=CAMNT_0013041755 /DNA_START=145 /DNA_END=870 /DNA_ORIENTATION=-